MFTFLRKIRKGLFGSNQTPKQVPRYFLYAIGEIGLVVIGILIALQINNWNEWRKERMKESVVLLDLRLNLENNITFLEALLALNAERQSSCRIILNVIEHRLPYQDSLDRHFHRSERGSGSANNLSFVGYEAFKNVGFDIITNKVVKDEILHLFESTYPRLINIDKQLDQNDAYHVEVLDKLFFRNKEGHSRPHDFDKLFENPIYYALLTRLYSERVRIIKDSSDCLAETRRVLQLVKNELGSADQL